MEFYASISSYYDHIFPLNKKHAEMVSRELPANSRVLDVGCATGSLSIELANQGFKVEGFDLDDNMVELALKKADASNSAAKIKVADMLQLDANYAANSFNGVVCFGNTLVHLNSEKNIEIFLGGVKSVLKEDGKLMLQILNYDFILENDITALPLIENETIRFDRYYEKRSDGLLDFNTILTVNSSGQQLKNSIQLMPLSKSKLEILLKQSGFSNIHFYKNFIGDAFDGTGLPLVVVAR